MSRDIEEEFKRCWESILPFKIDCATYSRDEKDREKSIKEISKYSFEVGYELSERRIKELEETQILDNKRYNQLSEAIVKDVGFLGKENTQLQASIETLTKCVGSGCSNYSDAYSPVQLLPCPGCKNKQLLEREV